MIRKILVFLLLICITASLSAQIKISKDSILNRDSLVKINELKFVNKKEKEYFLKYVNSKDINDAFHLLFYGKNENSNVDSILKNLNQDVVILEIKMKKLSQTKKMKFFYTYIHDKFFDKYVEYALFSDIFNTQEYNCLSASILYGYFLDRLGIPYEARMSSSHVYLVSFPTTLNIVLETTNPVSIINTINDDFKRDYINQMRAVKLIGSQEIEQFTVSELFSKYYFEEDIATMYEMIGAHYLNRAAAAINNFAFSDAYSLLLKAHVLDPGYKTIYSILQSGAKIISQDAYRKKEDAEILGIFSRFSDYGITGDMIVSDFNSLIKTQLFDNSDTMMLQNSYNSMMYYTTDSALKAEISHSYYEALSRYHFQSTKIEEALYYAEKAFQISPQNKDTERLLLEVFSTYVDMNQKNTLSYKLIFEKIEAYIKIKPALADHSLFGIFRLFYWIDLADHAFSKGNITEGDQYLNQFEKIVSKEYAQRLHYEIQNTYVNGSYYYYKKNNNKKAKEYIVRGLKILPDNYEFKRRLSSF